MGVKSVKRRIHRERDYKWGPTSQAPPEAVLAYETVYDASLGLGALREASSAELTAHCRKVAEAIRLVGFYLQPTVGGRLPGYHSSWQFIEIKNVATARSPSRALSSSLPLSKATVGKPGHQQNRPALDRPSQPLPSNALPRTEDLLMVWNDHSNIDEGLRGKRTPFNVAIRWTKAQPGPTSRLSRMTRTAGMATQLSRSGETVFYSATALAERR